MIEPWYVTRTDVLSATGSQETTRARRQVDRAIASASRDVDALCHRTFYPWTGTRTFDYPNDQRSQRLWLDQNELVVVTTLTAGGTDITDDVLPAPYTGPPFSYLELDWSASGSWSSSSTSQRAIAVTGVFGYTVDETAVGTLDGPHDDLEPQLAVTDSSELGVGSLLRVDDERVTVSAVGLLDTGQTLTNGMDAAKNDITLTVTDGTTIHAGEILTVGSERMYVRDVVGNVALVDRATDALGALTTHAIGETVYAPRLLTVRRGAVGTVAAPHDDSALVHRWDPPALVAALTLAEAVNRVAQEQASFGRTIGSGESQFEMSGRQLEALRKQVYRAHGRKARMRSV